MDPSSVLPLSSQAFPQTLDPATALAADPSSIAAMLTGPAGTGGIKAEPGASAGAIGAVAAAGGHLPQQHPTTDPEAAARVLAARMAAVGAAIVFEKSLTASDVGGAGRVVVPKSVAEQYFPRLEQPSGVTISASDLEGRGYTFKWRFWVNNSSRMYLLEGAGELHRNYGLETGDVMVFAQKPDGSLVVAGRVANTSDFSKKPTVKRPAVSTTSTGGGAAAAGPGALRSRAPRTARATPARTLQDSSAAGDVAGGPGGVGAAPPSLDGDAGGGGAGGGGGARGRKRKAVTTLAPEGTGAGWDARGGLRSSWGPGGDGEGPGGGMELALSVLELEAPSDGVFRALVAQPETPVPLGVALARNNRWTATLDLAGERYQAFFDTRDDAVEAITAAGASP